ncbi:MAG: 50S ribosomal protein L7/L12 [Coriobacteriia bacterium]|nr:50S ribosomal protein L7/L12 [Coriobacteriia bacterium]
MAITRVEIVEALKEMPALELSELVKELEEVFGVSAAAPMAFAAAPTNGSSEEVVEEEKTIFDVVLEGFGDNKIAVIKAVRELTGLGLKEAKDTVEGAPLTILESVDKAKADEASEKIKDAGGVVTLK